MFRCFIETLFLRSTAIHQFRTQNGVQRSPEHVLILPYRVRPNELFPHRLSLAPHRQKTPHQCKNVCDWEATERGHTRQSSAFSSHMHTPKNRKTHLPTVVINALEKRCTSFQPSKKLFTQQGGTNERKGHPRSTSTPC